MKSELTLSQEWILLSQALFGDDYINELSSLLERNKVHSMLDAGCGGGHILAGLREKGFSCRGIDQCEIMIDHAKKSYEAHASMFTQESWLDLTEENAYDAVLCRGNSLSYVVSWDTEQVEPRFAEENLDNSLRLFHRALAPNGTFVVDTVPEAEITEGKEPVSISLPNISLSGFREYDTENNIQRLYGEGTLFGAYFKGGSTGYLLSPRVLKQKMAKAGFCNIREVEMKHDPWYTVLAANKAAEQ